MPTLNVERHFENGHCNMPDQRRAAVAGLVGDKVERTLGKENDRPERPEKPERRPNSKELIEKQRNWTSHFSKTRPSRYNSDPNRSLVQTSLNSQNASHNATQQQQSSVDGLCQGSSAVNDTASPARSASFCSARSPPPPLPPIRNSSAAGRRERPASIAALSPSDLPESPEYATIEKFDDISPTIPEYAVVQKTKKPQEGPKENQDNGPDKIQDSGVPEYAVVQKNNSKSASKPTEAAQKEASKTTAAQNLKNSITAEAAPACKPVVSRSSESPKDASKVSTVQNSKGPTIAEAAPVCKSAFPRPVDVSKETSKSSATTEESFKTTVSKPTESPKETVDCAKEIPRSQITTEVVADTKIAITKEYNDLPEQTKTSLVLHCELSSPIRSSTSMDSASPLTRRESDLLEAPEYLNCPPSPIHSPAKTSEWRNEWLAKNDEILKRTVDLRDVKSPSREALEAEMTRGEVAVTRPDPRPDWARPNANVKRKEMTSDDKRTEQIRSPESELGLPFSAGTDSASSSMSSPSSPSKDSKEEKAEKEMSEKHQTGEFLGLCARVIFVVSSVVVFSSF